VLAVGNCELVDPSYTGVNDVSPFEVVHIFDVWVDVALLSSL